METVRDLEDTEEEEDSSYAKADTHTVVSWNRSIDIVNEIYREGIPDLGLVPRAGMGYRGDRAPIVLHLYDDGRPLLEVERQREVMKRIAKDIEDVTLHEDEDAQGNPVFVILKGGDINKKVLGFEWDKIVIYRPAPDVLDIINYLADQLSKLPPKRKH